MTVTESIVNMWDIYTEQEHKCAIAEKDYNNGHISLAAYLEECFMLIYDCAKLGLGAWSEEHARAPASVLTRHWQEFLDAMPNIKRRVIAHEGVEVRTKEQRLIIEARWLEALDLLKCGELDHQTHYQDVVNKPFFDEGNDPR